ncbi:hypothetical protein HQ545_00755 [Candidatus Woesearchaeota archaeon]|nr:hypothetical protein [Candidatus Woesearchaeota archaeon]
MNYTTNNTYDQHITREAQKRSTTPKRHYNVLGLKDTSENPQKHTKRIAFERLVTPKPVREHPLSKPNN